MTATSSETAQHAEYYRQVLHELIDMGVGLARLVRDQAEAVAGVEPAAVAELTVAFDRVSRAVRRTVGLARRLDEPVVAGRDASRERAAARRRVIRAVEDTIQREAAGEEEVARLEGEFSERLDAPDLDDDLDGRPVEAVIADICRDLGLAAMPGTRPWKRRRPGDVAVLHARAAEVGGGGAMPCPAGGLVEVGVRAPAERFFRLEAVPDGG